MAVKLSPFQAFLASLYASSAIAQSPDLSIQINPSTATTAVQLDAPITIAVTNKSSRAIKLWDENCSWGWQNLAVTVKSRVQKIELTRNQKPWRANVPSFSMLQPGESWLRKVDLFDGSWPSEDLEKLRAKHLQTECFGTLKIEPDVESKRHNIWTGNAISETRQSTFSTWNHSDK